ncbi:MAG: DUF6502 family protein [Gammaproteobacteria bacterium]
MKRKSPVVHGVRKRRARAAAGLPLDATALEAIERFTRVLARCGSSPSEISAAVSAACERIPKTVTPNGTDADRELANASHILTVWFSEPLYLGRDGAPLPLPVRGPAPSFESLVHRVDRSLAIDQVLKYLNRTHVLRRVGTRYAPRQRALSLRGSQGPTHFRSLRGLLGMLRTLEHNLLPKSATGSWFEYFAENPRFPVRALAAFDQRMDRHGMKFLQALDFDMHRRESGRREGEPTVRLGIGVYRFEDAEVPGAVGAKSKAARERRSGNRERRPRRRR